MGTATFERSEMPATIVLIASDSGSSLSCRVRRSRSQVSALEYDVWYLVFGVRGLRFEV